MWQNGYALAWAIAAAALTALAFLAQFLLLRNVVPRPTDARTDPRPATLSGADPTWTTAEMAAWAAVQRLGDTVDVSDLSSRDGALAYAQKIIETVAFELHPGRKEPLYQFTAPEALALVERVSSRMRGFIVDTVPLGDRLTVGQMLSLYRWRGVVDWVNQANDLWRIIRLLNPVTAATHEIRGQITKKLYEMGRDELTSRLGRAFVNEIGRAAIDLYGGRLRVSVQSLSERVSDVTRRDASAIAARPLEPLRILVAGKVKAGKSSTVNALLDEVRAAVDVLPATPSVTPYALSKGGVPAALILDTPGLSGDPATVALIVKEAIACDLILWVCDASRADRDIDARALRAIRDAFAARPNRRRPPVILVLSHVDKLRPIRVWSPPYDLTLARNGDPDGKATSIVSAMEAAGGDLGFAREDMVPVCLDSVAGRYNIDALWARIIDGLPDAQSAHLVRTIGALGEEGGWSRVWGQAVNAGRVLVRAV